MTSSCAPSSPLLSVEDLPDNDDELFIRNAMRLNNIQCLFNLFQAIILSRLPAEERLMHVIVQRQTLILAENRLLVRSSIRSLKNFLMEIRWKAKSHNQFGISDP